MPSRAEIFRREIKKADSPLSRHSTSSHELKDTINGQERLEHLTFGTSKLQRLIRKREELKELDEMHQDVVLDESVPYDLSTIEVLSNGRINIV